METINLIQTLSIVLIMAINNGIIVFFAYKEVKKSIKQSKN